MIRAFCEWKDDFGSLPEALSGRLRMLRYLEKAQDSDGAWTPLWFGNQHTGKQQVNRVYGTAQTPIALEAITEAGYADRSAMVAKGAAWLKQVQQADGSWGSDARDGPASRGNRPECARPDASRHGRGGARPSSCSRPPIRAAASCLCP